MGACHSVPTHGVTGAHAQGLSSTPSPTSLNQQHPDPEIRIGVLSLICVVVGVRTGEGADIAYQREMRAQTALCWRTVLFR